MDDVGVLGVDAAGAPVDAEALGEELISEGGAFGEAGSEAGGGEDEGLGAGAFFV